jgi:SOS-response transcriptional repressor LexA
MIEETPITSRAPAQGRKPDAANLAVSGRHSQQIANQFLFHKPSLSRNFPTFNANCVGNIPFAFSHCGSDNPAMENAKLRQRISSRLKELGIGAVEAATKNGLGRDYIRDFLEEKKASFSAAKLPLVAKALKWSVAELQNEPATPKRHSSTAPRITMVPLLDRVTAGRLRGPASQIPVEDVPLLAFADLGRGDFFALEVDGDSMDRYSPEGSIIVVNRTERDLVNGRSYVFSLNGETTYKVWQGGDIPYLAPHSTNPMNKPIFFKKRDLEVIGRVKRTLLDL